MGLHRPKRNRTQTDRTPRISPHAQYARQWPDRRTPADSRPVGRPSRRRQRGTGKLETFQGTHCPLDHNSRAEELKRFNDLSRQGLLDLPTFPHNRRKIPDQSCCLVRHKSACVRRRKSRGRESHQSARKSLRLSFCGPMTRFAIPELEDRRPPGIGYQVRPPCTCASFSPSEAVPPLGS